MIEELKHLSEKDRNLVFEITKIIAETDSIGEDYRYCDEYTRECFESDERLVDEWLRRFDRHCIDYVIKAGLPIFELIKKRLVFEYK